MTNASTKNAYNILRELATHVAERLRNNNLEVGEYVPYLAVLQEVYKQPEPVRTRLMTELKSLTFNIAASHSFRVMWDRRPYHVGPVARAYTLPIAIKIIQHAEAENMRVSLNAAGNDIRPILLFWDSFNVKQGDQEIAAQPSHHGEPVFRGSTYIWLLHQFKAQKTFEGRWGGTELKPNIADVFRAKVPGGPNPGAEVQDYSEVSNSVIHDNFSAAKGKGTMAPAMVQGALAGAAAPQGSQLAPPPPPGAEG